MHPKLITIDLDGTLLKNDCTISARSRHAILCCMNAGYLVVPCTGRSYENSRFVLQDFPSFPYYINGNGTTVTDGQSGRLLHANTMPLEIGRAIYSLCCQYQTFVELYHGSTAYDSAIGRENMRRSQCDPAYQVQLMHTNTHLESLDDFVLKEEHPISKFHIVCVDSTERRMLKERISQLPGISPISTTPFNIEVCSAGWSKREGLKWLCNFLDISPEQVLALGDSENDLEMLTWAGTGVAMGNAVPCVKEIADVIAASNEEDGVAQILEQIVVK